MTREERTSEDVLIVKDPENEWPIATAWRGALERVVTELISGNFALRGCPDVEPARPAVASQMEAYLAEYGKTLAPLPEETWRSSVAQWTSGYWDAVIDLWTIESGRSDLTLNVRVFEAGEGYRFRVDGVYVP